jgi:stage II sporulation protein D
MRRLALVIALLAALASASNGWAGTLFLISGRGWGHGVGLSQYGAYGFAQQGATYDQILAHYYPGTALGPAPVAEVRVRVAAGRKKLTIGSAAPFRVTDGAGQSFELEAGAHLLEPGLAVTVAGEVHTLVSPVRFDPGASPIELGKPYRGALVVSSTNDRLAAVNYVSLEQYLYGVIPREIPSTWLPEVLKAQAVAARSYALASRSTTGDFDLYSDVRSQVYGGLAAEDPNTTAAVDATAGQVVLYAGAVARTYFFSTSGGRTAASADVWGEPIPYLVPVDDPFDALSPYHRWGPALFSGAELVQRLGDEAPRGIRDLQLGVDSSGRVGGVTVVGRSGSAELTGATLRTALGLRSTWFDVGVLTLDAASPRILVGQRGSLNGIVRGVDSAALEKKAYGGVWEPVGPVTPEPDGTFAIAVGKPRVSTLYRLVASGVTGVPARIGVAARVTLESGARGKELRGRVRPLVPGAEVEIQRLKGAVWDTVKYATVDDAGSFRAKVRPGTYRAWARLGGGTVPGLSAPLELSPA